MSTEHSQGRLSTLRAAMIVARRDFSAILFSRSFFFFLLGPLFPVIVGVAAGSVGHKVESTTMRTAIGVAMSPSDTSAMIAADRLLSPKTGSATPEMVAVQALQSGVTDPAALLKEQRGNVAAIISGTPNHPVLTGTPGQINAWQAPISLIAAQAAGKGPQTFPEVALAPIASSNAADRQGRMHTAQSAQMLLFLLTMLLAGMVLSNLVEEKANKIIEVLAAAIPMDAVFYGKLFAMLGISFVGISVWGTVYGGYALATGHTLGEFAAPAIGWPSYIGLGIVYFAMAYLLLGSVFLTIGSMATTVREVQTLSMPVSMSQLVVFFFATFATAMPGSTMSFIAEAIPFSSPFAMLSRGAQEASLMPHLIALGWQAAWVALFVNMGASLFRRRVMKSGPQGRKVKKARLQPA